MPQASEDPVIRLLTYVTHNLPWGTFYHCARTAAVSRVLEELTLHKTK